MNFNFQQMKPVIQREFDDILDQYPTDFSEFRAKIPTGGDPYERKRIILKLAAETSPVHIFPHYPFAFELDMGESRQVCYIGVGNLCRSYSGIDFSPLHRFRQRSSACNICHLGDYTDPLHRTLDHEKLLKLGFSGVYEECVRLNETETDDAKRRYRELVMDCCLEVKKIGLRLREKAREMLTTAEDEDIRYNLTRIVNSVNTPWDAPVTMFDALNSILCTTLFISGLDGIEVNAYGQVDRDIEPFYQRDLKAGRITKEEAYFLIQCFLYKTDLHCHFNSERKNYDNGVSVMIGGCDTAGNPVYNEITDMIIDAYTENKLINPKLNARASSASPRAYIDRLAALMRTGNNNLIVENDDYIIPMFQRMGLSPEDARTYVGNGCQEVICRNQLHSRAFVYINTVQILLDTLRFTGEDLTEDAAYFYRYGAFDKSDFAALYRSYLANLRSYIRVITEEFAPYEKIDHLIYPEPMHSAFTADCIARGQDISEGGARYNHKTLSLVGFGTLCDSLLSLRTACETGTADRLTEAVNRNFEGDEAYRQTLLNSELRFGHSTEGDRFAKELAHDLAEVSRGILNGQGIEWRTSLFTYYLFKNLGQATGATPDGRAAHQPLSRQMNMASLPDLTTAAQSMSVLTEADFNDVGMFDIALPVTVTDSEEAHRALSDYIRTCILLKLPVLQTNTADIRTMKEERDQKGTHPDLVVRVCGYSAVFGQLSPDMQNEIISRAEHNA